MKSLKITQQITRRESESFAKYLQEIARLSKNITLTAKEEAELAERIKRGDKKAEKELIEMNLRFVISVAKQYQNEGCPLEDLVGEGNIGLIKAVRRFDASKGCKFISYAVWWIRESILYYLNENARTIRLPLNKIGQLKKIKKVQDKFEQIHHRRPTTDEVIETLNFELSSEDLEEMFLIDKGVQSLDVQITNNGSSKAEGFTLEDLLEDYTVQRADEHMETQDLKMIVKTILDKLSPNHKTVVEMYYGLRGDEPKTLDEIATYLDLSRERIRQIKNSALCNMESAKNYSIMKPYMK